MERVREYAEKIGGKVFEVYEDYSQDVLMDLNAKWLKEMMCQGRVIYDIGEDPARSIRSVFYEMEQMLVEGYSLLIDAAN